MLDDRKLRRIFIHTINSIISTEKLLAAWQEFTRGKRSRKDVQIFQSAFMDNILELRDDVLSGRYKHGQYEAFKINDPKPRDIHKALVRDRLIHHVLYQNLYPFFDRVFIADSFSCRYNKGTHRAMDRFKKFAGQVSRNHTRTAWVLKCDVRKFFASIDHVILKDILSKYIIDPNIMCLLGEIIDSFSSRPGTGLPLGNLTSQLLVNVYMNEFDQYMKHTLKAKHYIRYADDFVILNTDRKMLEEMLKKIDLFLSSRLKLSLHPNKVHIQTFASGVDFLGWVHFAHHRVIRTTTKRRMFKKLALKPESLPSYKALLAHGDAHKLSTEIDLLHL